MSSPKSKVAAIKNHPKQKQYLIQFSIFFVVLALLSALYWLIYARHYESTDNAYVSGNIIPVTSQISGLITAVNVSDTSFVKEGEPLILLDTTDRRIALDQAKANLALVLRQTQQLYIKDRGLKATIDVRTLNLKQADTDLKRRQQAIHLGGISQEELTHAQDGFNVAQNMLTTARAQWSANQALISGTSVMKHPNVLQAIAEVKAAYLALVRTTIEAPVAGFIAKRAAQVGQVVAPGSFLMAVVPLDQIWVDANFKEKQLRQIHPGQAVSLWSDLYGSSVTYHGYVVGLSGGTGSAFSLLPAQNATGNWIKVVQRLPVRIILDPKEIHKHPLRIGLSMEVEVDTSKQEDIPPSLDNKEHDKTTIFNHLDKEAEGLIATIIHDNLDKSAPEEAEQYSNQAKGSGE